MAEVTQQDLIDTINGTESQETPPTPTPEITQNEPTKEVDNPPAPVAEQAPETPTFNLDEELQKLTNGEITSKDQLSEILGKTKGLSELEAKLKTFEDENTSLKSQVNTNPFANDQIKKLNELYQKGASENTIEAYLRINKVPNIDDLEPLEARKLALQIKEGLTVQEAEEYVRGTYKLSVEDQDDPEEVAKAKMDAIRLKVDSNSDKEFLKTHKAEVSQAPVDNSAIESQKQAESHQKHVELLTPIAKSIVNELSFKDININGKDGEAAIKMDLEPTPESKAFVQERLLKVVNEQGVNIPNTEEGKKQLQEVASNILVLQNWKKWLADSTNTREKDVRAEYHNPTKVDRGNDNPTPGLTSKEELAQWVIENS